MRNEKEQFSKVDYEYLAHIIDKLDDRINDLQLDLKRTRIEGSLNRADIKQIKKQLHPKHPAGECPSCDAWRYEETNKSQPICDCNCPDDICCCCGKSHAIANHEHHLTTPLR